MLDASARYPLIRRWLLGTQPIRHSAGQLHILHDNLLTLPHSCHMHAPSSSYPRRYLGLPSPIRFVQNMVLPVDNVTLTDGDIAHRDTFLMHRLF